MRGVRRSGKTARNEELLRGRDHERHVAVFAAAEDQEIDDVADSAVFEQAIEGVGGGDGGAVEGDEDVGVADVGAGAEVA